MDVKYINQFSKLKNVIDSFDLSSSPGDEKYLLDFLNIINFLTFGFSKLVPQFERLTINKTLPDNNNETINEIRFLKNPPADCITKYNRANLKNQSVLYATFCLPTALNENNPNVGDLVTISNWGLKEENDSLLVYPVFDYFKTKNYQLKNEFDKAINNYSQNAKDLIIVDNCFIASCFSKYVEKGKEINYTLSAHIADKIFNKMYNGKIEAIIYPSVKDNADFSDNIALKPEIFNLKYKLLDIRESVVVSKRNGSIILKALKRTKEFDETIIKW